MNDWWNDPPEDRDFVPLYDIEPESIEEALEILEMIKPITPPKCPHGKEWGACDRCDFESDLAYDAW